MTTTPNQYSLHGRGIKVTYYPDGDGPVFEDGRLTFAYQDAHTTQSFHKQAVRAVDVADVGALVSVSISKTVDEGYTSFTLMVPTVQLPDNTNNPSVTIHTEGITTVHALLASVIAHPQTETYTVTPLTGTASVVVLAN